MQAFRGLAKLTLVEIVAVILFLSIGIRAGNYAGEGEWRKVLVTVAVGLVMWLAFEGTQWLRDNIRITRVQRER